MIIHYIYRMKPLLCCLILACLRIMVLAKPPKEIKEDIYLKHELAKLRDSTTYRQQLDQALKKTGFCYTADTSEVYSNIDVDTNAEFSGGTGAMLKFLANQVKYPNLAREYGIEGKVIAKFLIDESGNICNPIILRYVGFGIDEETVRILDQLRLQKWKPAYKDGRPVKTYYFLPITFKLA